MPRFVVGTEYHTSDWCIVEAPTKDAAILALSEANLDFNRPGKVRGAGQFVDEIDGDPLLRMETDYTVDAEGKVVPHGE